jgi:flagellar basal-body rod protein FlgC
MSDLSRSLAVSASGMNAQAARLRVTSENIANADTPGYHRKVLPFVEVVDTQSGNTLVEPGTIGLDPTDPEKIFDPTHPLAGEDGYYQGSNVQLILEIADAREAQRTYEANLKMMDQARQMNASVLDLLRR